jgi:hypothetical protein
MIVNDISSVYYSKTIAVDDGRLRTYALRESVPPLGAPEKHLKNKFCLRVTQGLRPSRECAAPTGLVLVWGAILAWSSLGGISYEEGSRRGVVGLIFDRSSRVSRSVRGIVDPGGDAGV